MKIEPNYRGVIYKLNNEEILGKDKLTTKYVRSSMLVNDTGMIRTIEL